MNAGIRDNLPGKGMTRGNAKPKCFGQKACPRGNKNERCFCLIYGECLEQYMALEFGRRRSPTNLLRNLRDILNEEEIYGPSDNVLLVWMGQVASRNGFLFGRKKVDRAIRKSLVNEDQNASFEKQEIRRAFGVFGREGMRRKSIAIGQTRRVEIEQEASQ